MSTSSTTPKDDHEPAVLEQLSTLDRFLPVCRYFPPLAHRSGPVVADLAIERS